MAEQQFEVRPVGVKYICDDCGKGELLYKNMTSTNGVYAYMHECPECMVLVVLPEKYPTIRHLASTGDTHG